MRDRNPRITYHGAPVHSEIEYLLDHLRPEDVAELAQSSADRTTLPETCCEYSKHSWLYCFDGKPAFAFGLVVIGTTGFIWGFGTSDTRRVMPAVTRFVRGVYFPFLFADFGIRRIEVRVPITSLHSIDWLCQLGASVECWAIHDNTASDVHSVQLAYTTREFKRDYPNYVLYRDVLPSSGSCVGGGVASGCNTDAGGGIPY